MSVSAGSRGPSETMLSEAAQWYLSIREGDWSLQDPDFNAWLEADPGHEPAFVKMQQAWASMEGLTVSGERRMDVNKQRWPVLMGMVASLVLVSGIVLGLFLHGESRTTAQLHET